MALIVALWLTDLQMEADIYYYLRVMILFTGNLKRFLLKTKEDMVSCGSARISLN